MGFALLLSIAATVLLMLEGLVGRVGGRPFIENPRRLIHDIHWNISNPMFDMSNTDHVIDVQVCSHDSFLYFSI